MTTIFDTLQRTDTVTFDCYGTLIDWRTGLNRSLRDLLGAPAATDLFDAYLRIEPQVQAEAYRPYRDVLAETARRVAREADIGLSARRAATLADMVASWPPFPDTIGALIELKKHLRLGVLSNIDRDIFEATAAQLGVAFDFVIMAEDVRAYKPAHAHFQRLLADHTRKDRVIHVAQSVYHDGAPCATLGIAFLWINRYNDDNTTGIRPLATYADLASFADAAGAAK